MPFRDNSDGTPALELRLKTAFSAYESRGQREPVPARNAGRLWWDREFESTFLQRPVCLSGEPRV
jgi:hypothetical protein